ncbi:MAG: SDR family NAD(P)-dependent oxidoreductase [Gammaproteobacteria bacterium]|nr:SDR family NAD(P)-dependent oxidoreductase [Gammaproteobacteria bacterium]
MGTHKTIIITGATTGIGEATAKLFADNGVKVYNFDMHLPEYSNPLIETIICNTSKYEDVKAAFDKVMSTEKELNHLFVNAGINVYGTLEDTSVEDINQMIDVDVKGYLFTLKCALPIMRKQSAGGTIVLNGSDNTFIGKHAMTVYGCSKGAVGQMTKGVAIDYAKFNIRVNCICPGTIDVPTVHQLIDQFSKKTGESRESLMQKFIQAQPMQKLGTPEEVARLVYFLCSDQTPFMTGSLISIDGGYVAQ